MEKEKVLENLRKLANSLKDKKYLTGNDLRSIPKLEYYARKHFGTLYDALKAAGLTASPLAAGMGINKEDLLNYLRDIKETTGHQATSWDIQQDNRIYKKYFYNKITPSIFQTRFGGLKKANELANKSLLENKDQIITDRPIDIDLRLRRKAKAYENNSAIDPEFAQRKKSFWGKAAELHVTAELLYRGFQAATIPVDVGLDVLAVKKNKTFYFQVKHKDIKRNEPIALTKSSFAKSGAAGVFYVFVLLSGDKRDFLIIPFHIVNAWIREGLVDEREEKYLLYISKKNDKYMLKEADLSHYLDKWEDIK